MASWSHSDRVSLPRRLAESVVAREPLRQRLEVAKGRIDSEATTLGEHESRLEERDIALFRQIVQAVSRHDSEGAARFSAELVEVRRLARLLSRTKMGLEHASLRIISVCDLGDLATMLSSSSDTIRRTGHDLSGAMPEGYRATEEIGNMLSDLATDLSGAAFTWHAPKMEGEVAEIVREASEMARKRSVHSGRGSGTPPIQGRR